MYGGEDEVDELLAYERSITLPLLQDTSEAQVEIAYGAEKWYFYLADREGNLRYLHYELDLDDERDRFLTEIQSLKGEEAP